MKQRQEQARVEHVGGGAPVSKWKRYGRVLLALSIAVPIGTVWVVGLINKPIPVPTGAWQRPSLADCHFDETQRAANVASRRYRFPEKALSKSAEAHARQESEARSKDLEDARVCEERKRADSDLAAQWHAATAAENATSMAMAGYILGLAELSLLIAAIVAAVWAALETRVANRIAKAAAREASENAQAQVRAYVRVERFAVSFSDGPMLSANVSNSGLSPTRELCTSHGSFELFFKVGKETERVSMSLGDKIRHASPNVSAQTSGVVTFNLMAGTATRTRLIEMIQKYDFAIQAAMLITWQDVFGVPFEEPVRGQINVKAGTMLASLSLLPGGRAFVLEDCSARTRWPDARIQIGDVGS